MPLLPPSSSHLSSSVKQRRQGILSPPHSLLSFCSQHWWFLGLFMGCLRTRDSRDSRCPDFIQPTIPQPDHCLFSISRLPKLACGWPDGSHSVLMDGAYGVCHGLAILHQCQLQDALLCPWPGFQWVSAHKPKTHINTASWLCLFDGNDGSNSGG